MVLGLVAKWGSIAGAIVLFVLFANRAAQVGIGNAASEIGSGITNVGHGIGDTGSGIAKFGQGIGAGITGLFSPLQFFKDLIFGSGGTGTNNPTAAAANNNTPTTTTQNTPKGSYTIGRLNASAISLGSLRKATSIVKSGGTTTTHFTGGHHTTSISAKIKAGIKKKKAGKK